MRTSLDQDLITLSPALQRRMTDGARALGAEVASIYGHFFETLRAAGAVARTLGEGTAEAGEEG